MNIFKRLQSFQYHKELIEILLKARNGVILINFIAPIIFFFGFAEIPANVLYFLTFSHFVVFTLRMLTGSNFLNKLHQLSDEQIRKRLKQYLFLILISNVLWSIASVYAVIYEDTIFVLMLLIALLTIISGVMATIGSIFHATFIYIMTILPTFIFSFAFIGDVNTYQLISPFLLLYLYVILSSSFRNQMLLENSISQRERIELLNKSLEQKVQKAVADTKHKEKLLQEQSRLAQMGEMISMIAHQWRQPLTSISSTVINLQVKLQLEEFNFDEKKSRDSFMEYLKQRHQNINEYVHFLSTTIDDFRDFFKSDKSRNLIQLTAPIVKTLQIIESNLTDNGIQIIKDFQTDDEVLIYQNEMTQVILNILKNCEDNFLEKSIADAKVTITTKKDVDSYIITISDNGGGIPEDILPKVFDPYFSTKDDKNGTGLGLYMSKTIIEKHHNGKLNAYNSGDGVVFEIILKPQII